ncbi:N-acetylglucosamine kinase [Oerskovia flava]|uniref:N-acetylglucosamine kinase n=1 Tax=Oerskovia flava TaxID=2986422 RepID=UPI00223FF323|nr:BadF/BadG/BcrA/BcrD ATPase family protein [Oerskovia sp. JB1-3-2]
MPSSREPDAWLLALDVGGSGSRLVARRLRPAGPARRSGEGLPGENDVTLTGRPVAVHAHGSDAADVVDELLSALRRDAPAVVHDGVAAAAVGVTGLATLVRDPDQIHDVLRRHVPVPRTAVAADALTAHLGALGGRAGAVVAVGTGAIALGTDLRGTWQRVDGWGHLIGDLGAGSWIGTSGLRAAVAAHDGRASGGSPALLAAATARFGPVEDWPGRLYTRPDRAQVLASFTPAVVAAAHDDDPAARQVLAGAGVHLATTLAAALHPDLPRLAAATGGVLAAGELLTGPLRARFAVLQPQAELVPAAGTPLDGALHLAERLALDPGSVVGHSPWLSTGPHPEPEEPHGR